MEGSPRARGGGKVCLTSCPHLALNFCRLQRGESSGEPTSNSVTQNHFKALAAVCRQRERSVFLWQSSCKEQRQLAGEELLPQPPRAPVLCGEPAGAPHSGALGAGASTG